MLRLLLLSLCLLPILRNHASAQDEDELPEFLPGLIADLQIGDSSYRRVDEAILFSGREDKPDERLVTVGSPQHPSKIRWHGKLFARENGQFTFSVFAQGRVNLSVDGQTILEDSSGAGEWLTALPIELSFGRFDVELEYEPGSSSPALGLYWAGPSFELEPITAQYFSHRAEGTVDDSLARGLSISRAHRCAACHNFHVADPILAGPSLTHLQGNLRPSWLVQRLTDSPAEDESPQGMPHFALPRNDALAISAALFDASEQSAAPNNLAKQLEAQAKRRKKGDPEVRTRASSEQGELTFASKGCIACHQIDALVDERASEPGLFSGGELSEVSTKRTRDFFARWLADPASVNKHHRMPIFELEAIEQADLIEYLSGLGAADSQNDTKAVGDIARGAALIARHRCASCHELPAALELEPIAKTNISDASDWNRGCLNEPNWREATPGFAIDAEDRAALKQYLLAPDSLVHAESGSQLLLENNCLACHSRDLARGIASQFVSLAESLPDLAPRLAAVAPPSLSSVGDKLHDSAILAAISGKDIKRRPWLDVQMPKFQLDENQQQKILDLLVSHDRIPQQSEVPEEIPLEKAAELAAGRLVTAEGFGCQSCHKIGDSEPPKVALNAHGNDLTMLGERIRRNWFLRWVRNPARIVPRMEMPAIQTPAQGLLDDSLDQQLAALWQTLNTPGFRPPKPNPVRIIRSHNLESLQEPTRVLTDVIETQDAQILRPLVFGMPNRNNFLFDLESGELRLWWLGDTARQHTRGKSWYWELGAQPLLENEAFLERFTLVDSANRTWKPTLVGQVAVELDELRHTDTGGIWSGRVNLSDGSGSRVLGISQHFNAQADRVEITTMVSGLQPGEKLILETSGQLGTRADDLTASFGELADATYEAVGSSLSRASASTIDVIPSEANSPAGWKSNYRSRLPADRFPHVDLPPPPMVAQELDCVPGYSAVKLPLPPTEMPISMAWSPDGQLFIGSLKGRVLQVNDSDDDGLEDTYQLISDQIPTPYGLYYTDAGLDALAKFALIRLTQPESGRIWNAQVVADGWGYTSDYHDWAVGLERDAGGNYYMALPCQQDDRSEAAAYLRGNALKLVPNSDSESPRAYRIEPFAAGLRFPMGIALSASGDLFTSDNQGNYNPFNELNHLRQGRRYGFINKLENKDGFSPPFESPAINLPHPWTRSVNGMCFLKTPASILEKDGEPLFGPFEGHLIGCEMNNRALIRMSLQQVGDTFQGAAYLFSSPTSEGQVGFEGPIVCEVSPTGDIVVGNLQDSGWGGGQNTGSIVRLHPSGALPLGIAEVRATQTGFTIDFTAPVDASKASDPKNYSLRSYKRTSTPAYGGDDQDERDETIASIEVSKNKQRVQLELDDLREGYVYEINVASIGPNESSLFPSQAHYTLRSIPDPAFEK